MSVCCKENFLKKKKNHAAYETADTKKGLFLRVHQDTHKPKCIVSIQRSLLKHCECFGSSGQPTGARLYQKKSKTGKKKRIKCSCNCCILAHLVLKGESGGTLCKCTFTIQMCYFLAPSRILLLLKSHIKGCIHFQSRDRVDSYYATCF